MGKKKSLTIHKANEIVRGGIIYLFMEKEL